MTDTTVIRRLVLENAMKDAGNSIDLLTSRLVESHVGSHVWNPVGECWWRIGRPVKDQMLLCDYYD